MLTETKQPGAVRPALPLGRADLPEPPRPVGLAWMGVVGPGVIVLGASIGSGEFLLGPTAFVAYGLTLLWVTTVAAFLQTVLNTELMRYTMATGEPIFTGFMRTRPNPTFWAWFYALLYILQVGWPGWAGAAAGAIYFLFARELAGPEQAGVVYWIGVGTFGACILILLFGRRIERTLEVLNWVLVSAIMVTFAVLAMLFVPPATWVGGLAGMAGYDPVGGAFRFFPVGADFFLIGAFAAYSGAGGVINLTLSNWARDKGTAWPASWATSPRPWEAGRSRWPTTARPSSPTVPPWSAGAGGGASCGSTSGASTSRARCWGCCSPR